MTFSLTGIANHVLRIGDQWENRARRDATAFRTTSTSECKDYLRLKSFSYPVQALIVDQYNKTRKVIDDDDESADEMSDELICFIDCLFHRQYQLPCMHLWHYEVLFNLFNDSDWNRWSEMFEDDEFEVYESTTLIHVDVRHEDIEDSDRHMLKMRKILDHIKEKDYKMTAMRTE